jgi:outer membrane protein assembly factor BamA
VTVSGKEFPGRQWLLDTSLPRPGTVFRTAEWEQAVRLLLVGVGDQGYPFARWMVRDVMVDRERAEITIEAVLFPGVRAYLGPQTSALPSARGQDFLVRAAGLHTGRLFRHSDLQQARKRLLGRGLYTHVDEPVVYLTAASDTVGIFWPASLRQRTNRLGVILGFNQNPDGGGGRLSGQVDIHLPNLASTGRRLDLGWSNDGDARSRLAFGYLEPLIFGTAFDTELNLEHEVLDQAYTRFSVAGAGQLPLESTWGLELGVGWDRTTYPVGAVQQTSRWRIGGAFLHRRLDPARSGWSGRFALQTARRQASTRPDTTQDPQAVAIVGQVQQRIIDLNLAGELWLGSVWSLASHATYREVTSTDGSAIPLSEQYWFGGARSVRGYREDEFHGSRIAFGGAELRIGRAGGARLYTFFDLGYFSYSTDSPSPGEPAVDVERNGSMRGFGLGFQTRVPGGDISLAVGFPGSLNYDEAKLHVSLLEAF